MKSHVHTCIAHIHACAVNCCNAVRVSNGYVLRARECATVCGVYRLLRVAYCYDTVSIITGGLTRLHAIYAKQSSQCHSRKARRQSHLCKGVPEDVAQRSLVTEPQHEKDGPTRRNNPDERHDVLVVELRRDGCFS